MSRSISKHMEHMNPSLIRELFKAAQREDMISFTAGSPSPEEFPAAELAELSKTVFTKKAVQALSYGVTEGYEPLRRWITDDLISRGICGTEDDVIVVSGGQQALDFTAKCLVDDGDTVLTEAPTFLNALNTFRTYGANLVGVPMDGDGMDMEALEQALQREKNVKFIYTIPNFQNPMGVTLSAARRRRLYELAVQYDVMILEDDPYGKLRYSGEEVAAIKTLDGGSHVIYTGSFSKVIAPGVRVAYLCAPKALIAKMVVAKQCVDVHTNMISQILVHEYLTRYDLEAHIRVCCDHYRCKRDAMLAAIDRFFPKEVSVTRPEGGLFLWVTLPEGVSGMAFQKYAAERGVAVVPGAPFFADNITDDRGLRLNFSVPSLEQIEEGMQRMGEGLCSYLQS